MTTGAYKWNSQVPWTSNPCSINFSASLLSEDQSVRN